MIDFCQNNIRNGSPKLLWLQAFINNLETPDSGEFLSVVNHTLQYLVLTGDDLHVLQNALSAIQRHIGPYRDTNHAYVLLGQARTMVGKIASQSLVQQQLQTKKQNIQLRFLNQKLLTSFDVPQLIDILSKGIQPLGIPSFYLVLYNNPQTYIFPSLFPNGLD